MKILVYGASGRTGHALVRQALLHGHHVTAFVRHAQKLKIQNQNLDIVGGDITLYDDVKNSVMGKDAVFSALGASSPFKFDDSVVKGVKNIVQAMEDTGVERFVYQSAALVHECRAKAGKLIKYVLPIILSTEAMGHEIREEFIRRSALKWTIVRPVTLTNGPYTGRFIIGEELFTGRITATVSRADVASFMLSQVTSDKFIHKAPMIMY